MIKYNPLYYGKGTSGHHPLVSVYFRMYSHIAKYFALVIRANPLAKYIGFPPALGVRNCSKQTQCSLAINEKGDYSKWCTHTHQFVRHHRVHSLLSRSPDVTTCVPYGAARITHHDVARLSVEHIVPDIKVHVQVLLLQFEAIICRIPIDIKAPMLGNARIVVEPKITKPRVLRLEGDDGEVVIVVSVNMPPLEYKHVVVVEHPACTYSVDNARGEFEENQRYAQVVQPYLLPGPGLLSRSGFAQISPAVHLLLLQMGI